MKKFKLLEVRYPRSGRKTPEHCSRENPQSQVVTEKEYPSGRKTPEHCSRENPQSQVVTEKQYPISFSCIQISAVLPLQF